MANASQIVALKKKRTSIKASCTRIRTYVDTILLTEATPHIISNLAERREKLSLYWTEYNNTQYELELLCEDESNDRIAFEEMYFDLTATLRRMTVNTSLNNAASTQRSVSVMSNDSTTNNPTRLPKLDLPKFGGKYEDWFPFYDNFNATIHNNTALSDIQKFQYLKSSVIDEAAEKIASLELASHNYQIAWNILKQRYDNKRKVVYLHLRSLFELPSMSKENASELRQISDGASKHIQALTALQRPTNKWDDMIICLLTSKLDVATSRAWQNSLTGQELPTFQQFMDFLNHRCQVLETSLKLNIPSTSSNSKFQQTNKKQTVNVASAQSPCSYCKGAHLIYYCSNFLNLSIPQRIAEARKHKLCTNCLRVAKHSATQCASGICKTCGNKHNSLLHLPSRDKEESKQSETKQSETSSKQEKSTEGTVVTTHSSASYDHCVLLSTAVCHATNGSGCKQTCRILLDSGSQANFITRSCATRLKLASHPSNITISGINGIVSNSNEIVRVRLQSRLNNFTVESDFILTDQITERLPNAKINHSSIHIPKNIQLADPEFHKPSDIDMLIGAELFWKSLCVGQFKSCHNHPTIQKTRFGWIIAGRLQQDYNKHNYEVKTLCTSIQNAELQDQLSKFWQLEEILNTNSAYSLEEQFCEIHFIKNVRRTDQGQFIVRLPIKEDKLQLLGDTREIAMRRFYKLETRLNQNPELKLQYTQFMHEYLSLRHMKPLNASNNTDNSPTYYLPHHCVLRPDSETTKLRVVFDGSCVSTTGISLNDVLMVGPTIQQDLFSIILRFRTFKFVFTADITKMYRQVLIDPTQTSLQRIFWRDDASQDLQIYELSTVTYGTSAAPYLATKSLKYLAELYAKDYPIGAQHIIRDFYVDDILTGADTIQDAIQARNEIIQILDQGLFHLNKWSSNNPSVLHGIQDKSAIELKLDKESTSRILGILWNPSTDSFKLSIQSQLYNNKLTKRTLLSEISKLFDPLGLIGPVIIIPKLLIQEIWQLKIDWDQLVPIDISNRWHAYRDQLVQLNKLSIPRYVNYHNINQKTQLHGFCDASQRAYGACIYIRTQTATNEFHTELLCSKTRVAPLKTISVPRLELCAALLLAQLVDKVNSSITVTEIKTFLWSDSTITLHWISSCSRKWAVFVANRIGEIQRLTNQQDWHHVSSSENPADLLSRGAYPNELINSSLWWHGPEFLKNVESYWPRVNSTIKEDEMPELKKSITTTVATSQINSILELLHKFSNLNKICRILAYCLRFIRSRKSKVKHTSLLISHEEVSDALNILCKLVQKQVFHSEFKLLKNGSSLNTSNVLASLSPFLDAQEFIRVGGRLKNSQLNYNAMHPVLLPKNHRLTHLIIEREHIRNLHAGLQATIAATRKHFWPLSIRSTARLILRKCIICFKCNPFMSEAQMGVLPPPRVTPSRPFSNCGIDYAGPIILREGKRRNARNHKAYIGIFVCFATKAVHIELVSDLTTESFLASLKRFISRRGKPVSIYSDNGTTFVGASRKLSEMYDFLNDKQRQNDINQFLSNSKITWNFIPPNAPHYGGLWESAVKSTKFHLKRIMGNAHLTFEELQTLLCEIEAILNSRPLTPLSSDPNDVRCITPGHFLVGDAMDSFPCHDLTDIKENRLLRWQRVEQLRQHFWSRWSSEYLHQLQQRHKWKANKGKQLEPGQVVLIKQQNMAPLQWIIGRVQQIHPGQDGIARSATIFTTKGSIVRPLSRLSILPIED